MPLKFPYIAPDTQKQYLVLEKWGRLDEKATREGKEKLRKSRKKSLRFWGRDCQTEGDLAC